jgi:hypothetical protein
MKKIILCTILTCMVMASYAGNNKLSTSDILSVKPQVSTKNDLENFFGKPDKYVETNEQGHWEYKTDDMTITFIWDTKTTKVQRYSIHAIKSGKSEWTSKNLQYFNIGTTTPNDVIERLGLPGDMYTEIKSSQLKYNYQNVTLSLRFNNGVLAAFYVEQTKS